MGDRKHVPGLVGRRLQRPPQAGFELRFRIAVAKNRPDAYPVTQRSLTKNKIPVLVRIQINRRKRDQGDRVVRQALRKNFVQHISRFDLANSPGRMDSPGSRRNHFVQRYRFHRLDRTTEIETQELGTQINDLALRSSNSPRGRTYKTFRFGVNLTGRDLKYC